MYEAQNLHVVQMARSRHIFTRTDSDNFQGPTDWGQSQILNHTQPT